MGTLLNFFDKKTTPQPLVRVLFLDQRTIVYLRRRDTVIPAIPNNANAPGAGIG